ncbi:SEC12-like protein 2 [Quercus suber]|uniref:SEC12-like protein 2 n=2 Tax=Quercus suber TaxID=58331 RepID=UPI0032E049B0
MRRKKIPSPSSMKYGVPLYSVGWVIFKDLDRDRSSNNGEVSNSTQYYVVSAGGGGEGRSGIPNAILISSFNSDANSLSDVPVFKLETRSDLPYRTAVHPNGGGVLCSFPNSCRWYEMGEKEELCKLILKESDKLQPLLENVGQQLSLAFNNEGSALAAGGEDGNLRVFEWPSMVIILDEAGAHKSVKDLDFSPDGKYLVSVGNSGPAKVWDLTSKTTTASLLKENDEVFCFCRFSVSNDMNQVLYIAAATGKGGSIVTWDTKTWKRIGSKTVVRDTISAFSVSPDGKFLACGTTQGDVFILNSASKQVQTVVRKAHLGFVTALSFSHDSRALASVSLDSSARVTLIEEKREAGELSLWVVFVLLLAVVAYFMKNQGIQLGVTVLKIFKSLVELS